MNLKQQQKDKFHCKIIANTHCKKVILFSMLRKNGRDVLLLNECDCTLSPAVYKDGVQWIINM